jgi:phospholipid/cholesterol/gamma-HCH transport system substrate-binding protein
VKRSRLSPFAAGLIAIVVIVIGSYLGFTKKIPFRSHFEIKAAFTSSNNLKPNSPVRIAGVEVGKVAKVEPTSKGADSAIVTMRINDMGRPIHADATAKIRPRIFLEGNFFVDLHAGSAGAPDLKDGDTIPATQTSTPVQLDEVLKALNSPTRKNLQLTLGELGKAFDKGLAKSFDKSLPDQAPAFKFSSIVAEALLGRRPHDLSGVVRDFATTAAALDRSPPRLKSLLTNFNIFAHSLAVEDGALQAAVGELPRTLAAAGPALDSLNAAFPPTRRFAVDALPGVRSSLPAVAALRPLVAQLNGLVGERELRGLSRDLRGATPGLVKLSTRSVGLFKQLRPLASCLNNVVLPWSKDTVPDAAFPETGPVYQSTVKWLPGLAGESRSFDANGQWFKVLGSGGLETVELGRGLFGIPLFPVEGVNPPPTARPPISPDTPCETQEKPNLETVPQGPPTATKIDTSSAAFKQRYEASKLTAIASLRSDIAATGSKLTVSTEDATKGLIDQLAARAGNLPQLRALREGKILNKRNIKKAGG